MSVAVLLALATLGGAGDSEQAALREARQHWRDQRTRDYTYVLRRSCFCLPAHPVVNAADEEFSYRITKLRITRRYPPIGG